MTLFAITTIAFGLSSGKRKKRSKAQKRKNPPKRVL
jgi:hypothetical protein